MLPSWSTADTTFSRPDRRGAKSQRTTPAVHDARADATNKYKGLPIKHNESKSTDSFIFWDVHDLEGFNGLGEQIRVLQAGNGHVSTGQEAVIAEILQAQLR